ncbi:unnamed protein product, partial [Oncorhynchus mykiss]
DDSDDDGLGEGPSLRPVNQHAALAIKEESCDLDEEGLVTEGTILNGTPSQEHKEDKASLYNFSKLKKSRKWLKSILLSDDTSESDTEDSDFSLSREELQDMLRLHQFTREHQNKFHNDREVRTHTHTHTHVETYTQAFMRVHNTTVIS